MSFAIDINPADAIDAFYHLYAYAARRRDLRGAVARADGSVVDG